MWRSGLFWQFFLVSGALPLAAVVLSAAVLGQQLLTGSETADAAQAQVWLTVGLAGAAGLAAACWTARRLTRPLQELAQGARQIAAGEYGRKVFTEGPEEVDILARSVNRTSERLAAQFRQIDEDRQLLRAVLGGMAEGVVALDAEQNILFANERAAQLLEFDARTAVGRRLWAVIRQRGVHEAVNDVLHNTQGRQCELNWHGPPAKSLTIRASPLPGAPPRGAVLVLHDTTELRRLERLRQEFVANVSHELKTPLTVIKANVETLLDGAIDDVGHRGAFLQRIAEQAEHLHNLILDLLSLARIESGAETFVLQAVPVAKVVETCLQHFRTLAEEKEQLLHAEAPPEEVSAWADEEALLQIVENLVDNAIKYTPEKGRIVIRWRAEGEWVILEVEDTGLGIPAPDLPRIFERFYRVDKARSRQLGGTGLGLSIVKHLAQALHGQVQAQSEVGRGSTFTVRLPRHSS